MVVWEVMVSRLRLVSSGSDVRRRNNRCPAYICAIRGNLIEPVDLRGQPVAYIIHPTPLLRVNLG